MNNCIFCKIINKEIPSNFVFENDDCVIINDINPQANKHFLLIPKTHYSNIAELAINDGDLLARCFKIIGEKYIDLGLTDGFRVITNKGVNGCQSVEHIHIHILGGNKLSEKMG